MLRMLRENRQLYGWALIVAIFAFALGVRVGRHHPYSIWENSYGWHSWFHPQQPDGFAWLSR